MNRYQYARADGEPNYHDAFGFDRMWADAEDQLRFHKGKGFTITDRKTGDTGPARRLSEVASRVHGALDALPELAVVEVRSVADPTFALAFRREQIASDHHGQQLVAKLLTKLGMPYLRDAIVSSGRTDCSGLTMWGWNSMGIDAIPHNAHAQHLLFGVRHGFVDIPKAKLEVGDAVFCDNDAHVATYYGMYKGHPCVIDTEPHDTVAPWGGNLGTGVRIRPMDGNYYCAKVNGCGRIVEINGPA